jgi:hypothetical protein
VLIISEDTAHPYEELLKSYMIEDYDVKPIIEEAFIKPRYMPVLDVTGQRQRERLFKKKKDFWVKQGKPENNFSRMREEGFWKKLTGF